MKTTVLLDELHRADVRPDAVSDEYARLRREEGAALLKAPALWTDRAPPEADCDVRPAFVSDGIGFHYCVKCGSIFAARVPQQAELDRLARDGAAARLRRDYYGQRFSERQRATIHAPLLRWAGEIADEYALKKPAIAFVGADETGVAAAIAERLSASHLARIAGYREEGERFSAADAPSGEYDLVVDLGSLERVADPAARLALWSRLLKPGGLLAFTTSSGSGLEYRLLGANAPSFLALDRLTLYSIPALRRAVEAAGLKPQEVSTPGRVDVELIKRALEESAAKEGADAALDFWRHAFAHGTPAMQADLQMFLQRHRFSSYVRVLARRIGA